METNNYWWEEEFNELFRAYQDNEYMSTSDIKLFILKVIEAEKGKQH